MPKQNGYVIYNGPSLIDGKPIVVIAIRTTPRKANRKTGAIPAHGAGAANFAVA